MGQGGKTDYRSGSPFFMYEKPLHLSLFSWVKIEKGCIHDIQHDTPAFTLPIEHEKDKPTTP